MVTDRQKIPYSNLLSDSHTPNLEMLSHLKTYNKFTSSDYHGFRCDSISRFGQWGFAVLITSRG